MRVSQRIIPLGYDIFLLDRGLHCVFSVWIIYFGANALDKLNISRHIGIRVFYYWD